MEAACDEVTSGNGRRKKESEETGYVAERFGRHTGSVVSLFLARMLYRSFSLHIARAFFS